MDLREAREHRAVARTGRHRLIECRPRGGEVSALRGQHAEDILRVRVLVAPGLDPAEPRTRGGLRTGVDVELGQTDAVGVAQRVQRVRVLERDHGSVQVAGGPTELADQVVRPPRAGHDRGEILQRFHEARLIATLERLRGDDEQTLLGDRRGWVRADGIEVSRGRAQAGLGGGARIACCEEGRVHLVIHRLEQRRVRRLVGRGTGNVGRDCAEGLGEPGGQRRLGMVELAIRYRMADRRER